MLGNRAVLRVLVGLSIVLSRNVRASAQSAPVAAPPETALAAPAPSPEQLRLARHGALRPYRLNLAVDLPVLAASASLWAFPETMIDNVIRLGRCPCDPAQLNLLDRPVAGQVVGGALQAQLSDAATGILLGLPAVIDAFDVWRSGGSAPEWIEDTLVIGQALLVGGALNEVTKIAFQRPRPAAYGIDPGSATLRDPGLYMSFYSLAGAEVFTAAVAGSVTYALRHPHSPMRWVYLSGALTLASGFGLSRVLLGKHFPTDVLAGAVLGSAIGFLVPWLHRREIPLTLGASASPGQAMVTATLVWR